MRLVERAVALLLVAVIAAAVISAAAVRLELLAIVATGCFVVVRLITYYTSRW